MCYVLAILDEGDPHPWSKAGRPYVRCVMDIGGLANVMPIARPENATHFASLEKANDMAKLIKKVWDLDLFPVPRMT